MPRKSSSPLNEQFSNIREKLHSLNQRVKKFSPANTKENGSVAKEGVFGKSGAENVSLDDMRKKLRRINSYLRQRITGEEEPEELKAPVASEIVREEKVEEEFQAEAPYDDSARQSNIDLPNDFSRDDRDVTERVGVGLDLGTAYIVASREVDGAKVFVKDERNAFLSVRRDKSTQALLERLKIKYIAQGNHMHVLGNIALDLANIFNRETQRSMNMGILNPSEAESVPVIKLLIENVLWKPRESNEICCFSIPAQPIDRDQDTIYHKGVFEGILRSIGFKPMTIDEGYAVVLSELESKDFTGIGVSCGGGMVNVCAAFKSVPVLSFSITRGGDWIDKSASAVLGIPASAVTQFKEQGMNIKNPSAREEEAIAIYYRNYINYFLKSMSQVFGKAEGTPQFKDPVDIVFAGGSSMVGGFLDVVDEELKTIDMGFDIGEIKLAEDPFTSVSRGCLFHAITSE